MPILSGLPKFVLAFTPGQYKAYQWVMPFIYGTCMPICVHLPICEAICSLKQLQFATCLRRGHVDCRTSRSCVVIVVISCIWGSFMLIGTFAFECRVQTPISELPFCKGPCKNPNQQLRSSLGKHIQFTHQRIRFKMVF